MIDHFVINLKRYLRFKSHIITLPISYNTCEIKIVFFYFLINKEALSFYTSKLKKARKKDVRAIQKLISLASMQK